MMAESNDEIEEKSRKDRLKKLNGEIFEEPQASATFVEV